MTPIKGPFAQRIEDWEKMLTLMSDVSRSSSKLFSSDDIMRQLTFCKTARPLQFTEANQMLEMVQKAPSTPRRSRVPRDQARRLRALLLPLQG